MRDKPEYFIDTDILVGHLNHNGNSKSSLEKAMLIGICFTSVINASELYIAARNIDEKEEVDKLLRTLNVLGLHARYSLNIYDISEHIDNLRDAMICALVKNNKLPVLTNNKKKYKFADIELIDPQSL